MIIKKLIKYNLDQYLQMKYYIPNNTFFSEQLVDSKNPGENKT